MVPIAGGLGQTEYQLGFKSGEDGKEFI